MLSDSSWVMPTINLHFKIYSLLARLCSEVTLVLLYTLLLHKHTVFMHESVLYRSLDGYWSEKGCEVKSRYEESQYKYVECRCTHLSTFAVLMDLSDDDVRSVVLE